MTRRAFWRHQLADAFEDLELSAVVQKPPVFQKPPFITEAVSMSAQHELPVIVLARRQCFAVAQNVGCAVITARAVSLTDMIKLIDLHQIVVQYGGRLRGRQAHRIKPDPLLKVAQPLTN